MKIRYLAAILKRYKYFILFFPEIWLWLEYIYGVKIILQIRWESGFSGGFHGTPLCTNGSAGYLMQLSVKKTQNKTKQNKTKTKNKTKQKQKQKNKTKQIKKT